MIASLVLCDTTACYGPGIQPMWDARISAAETHGMTEELIEGTLAIWFTPPFLKTGTAVVDGVRAMMRATDPRGYVAAIRAIRFVDLTERLGTLRCPTLVVVGEDDPGTPPAMAQVIAERIPGARLTVLPAARHAAVLERASDFNQILTTFLQTLK